MLTEREIQSLRDLIARLELENRKLTDENVKLQRFHDVTTLRENLTTITPVPIPDRRKRKVKA
jgi:hypothetical protein